MSIDYQNDLNNAKSRINAYKTTRDTQENTKKLSKERNGNNFEFSKSESSKQLNEIKDKSQRLQEKVKSQYEELIELFKISSRNPVNNGSNTIDFLVKQILGASQNTKSRITEILVDETLKVAGCSEEQNFTPGVDGNKIYIRVNQIDLQKLLNKSPNEGNGKILYESGEPINGLHPYPMDKQLFNRLQNEGTSFQEEYGQSYIGGSTFPIMDIKYVTSYTINGVTNYGDYFEISLQNRQTGNSVSDFLRDYYDSIDIFSFDDFTVKLMNILTNIIDIDLNISKKEKEDKTKFEKIIERKSLDVVREVL